MLLRLRYLIIALLLAAAVNAVADTGYRSIVVYGGDDRTMIVNISDDLETTFDGVEMCVASEAACYYFNLENLRWKFSETLAPKITTGEVDSEIVVPQCDIRSTEIEITGLADNAEIIFADLQGRVLVHDVAKENYVLSLEKFPRGIYILRFGSESIKISVK